MNENDIKYYKLYGELAADRFILNEMLNMLQNYEDFNYEDECQAAKMYKSEAEALKRWYWHVNNPPVNEIYRLLGHLQEKYIPEYTIAVNNYIKSNTTSLT